MTETKTHWLQTPNKNYMGHWDLPNGKPVILTIKSAQWEEVKNPIINTSEAKRVVRFSEDYKPFICNETNAQAILISTACKFMEDSISKKIKLFASTVKVKGEVVDCLRVAKVSQKELNPNCINLQQINEIEEILPYTGKTSKDICDSFKIKSLSEIPEFKFISVIDRLTSLKKGLENGNT